MKTTISKCFDFDAAHFLPNVPKGHKCGGMHGHTYRVELVLEGEPTKADGWFIDYAEIADAWEPLHKLIDHKVLNEVVANPTTEVLCAFVMGRLTMGSDAMDKHLRRVRIYESSTTWCEVSR